MQDDYGHSLYIMYIGSYRVRWCWLTLLLISWIRNNYSHIATYFVVLLVVLFLACRLCY